MATHIHIGAGNLGLGLIIPTTYKRFDKVKVFNRIPKTTDEKSLLASNQAYCLQYDTALHLVKSPNLQFEFYVPEDFTDQNPLIQSIADPDTLFLTTAVGPGFEAVGRHIIKALELRDSAPLLLVVPCENKPDCAKTLRDMVSKEIPGGVCSVVECIVDRFCNAPHVYDGQYTVSVEKYFEWKILSGDAPVYKLLYKKHETVDEPEISVVDIDEFELAKIRKRWFVNGTDLLLACRAYKLAQTKVSGGLDDYGQSVAKIFADVSAYALEKKSAELGISGYCFKSNKSYWENVVDRIKSRPNDTARVMIEIMSPRNKDVSRWISKINDRICVPLVEFGKLDSRSYIIENGLPLACELADIFMGINNEIDEVEKYLS